MQLAFSISLQKAANRSRELAHIVDDHFADFTVLAALLPQVIPDVVDQHWIALLDKKERERDDIN